MDAEDTPGVNIESVVAREIDGRQAIARRGPDDGAQLVKADGAVLGPQGFAVREPCALQDGVGGPEQVKGMDRSGLGIVTPRVMVVPLYEKVGGPEEAQGHGADGIEEDREVPFLFRQPDEFDDEGVIGDGEEDDTRVTEADEEIGEMGIGDVEQDRPGPLPPDGERGPKEIGPMDAGARVAGEDQDAQRAEHEGGDEGRDGGRGHGPSGTYDERLLRCCTELP